MIEKTWYYMHSQGELGSQLEVCPGMRKKVMEKDSFYFHVGGRGGGHLQSLQRKAMLNNIRYVRFTMFIHSSLVNTLS